MNQKNSLHTHRVTYWDENIISQEPKRIIKDRNPIVGLIALGIFVIFVLMILAGVWR